MWRTLERAWNSIWLAFCTFVFWRNVSFLLAQILLSYWHISFSPTTSLHSWQKSQSHVQQRPFIEFCSELIFKGWYCKITWRGAYYCPCWRRFTRLHCCNSSKICMLFQLFPIYNLMPSQSLKRMVVLILSLFLQTIYPLY